MVNQKKTSVEKEKFSERKVLLSILEDLKEEKRKTEASEERVIYLNSLLKMIRDVNQLILTEKNKESLICSTIKILSSKPVFGCIFFALFDSGKVSKIYHESKRDLTSKDLLKIHSPKYLREVNVKKVIFISDVSGRKFKQHFSKVKSHAGIALSLDFNGRFFGTLTVHFPPEIKAENEEINLLKELAGDISHALYRFEIEEKRKQAEIELINLNKELELKVKERTQDLEKANGELKILDKAKDEFIMLASHELKSPLFPITGYAELFLRGDLGEITGEQRDKIQIMLNNAESLMGLINDLVDLSKLGVKKMGLSKKSINLVKLAIDVKEEMMPFAKENNAQIKVVYSQKVNFSCDQLKIKQIMANLVRNSILYNKKSRTNKVVISISKKKDSVVFKVKDQGRGLSKKDQERIFDKFYRVSEAVTSPEGGAGVGLSIVKGLVELHGGSISVNSKLGVGTEFIIELPKSSGKKS